MALIKINGIDMPAPTKLNVTLQDIDSENTQRTETGLLTRDRVRAGVYKLSITWLVTTANLKKITDAVSAAKFSVTFFDPTTNSNPTKDMYSGDRAGDLKHYDQKDPSKSYWEISFNLIEY
jgi:hypothetical protein